MKKVLLVTALFLTSCTQHSNIYTVVTSLGDTVQAVNTYDKWFKSKDTVFIRQTLDPSCEWEICPELSHVEGINIHTIYQNRADKSGMDTFQIGFTYLKGKVIK